MTYNTTNITDANSLAGALEGVNQLTNGLFSIFIIGSLFLILLIMFQNKADPKNIFIAASFITTLVSALFWGLGWIGVNILFYPIVMLMAAVIVKLFTSD
jgi:hypothetical protein